MRNWAKSIIFFNPGTLESHGGREDTCIYTHALDFCLEIWKMHKVSRPWKWQSKRLISPFPPFFFCKWLNASSLSLFGGIFSLDSSVTILCPKYFFCRISGTRGDQSQGTEKTSCSSTTVREEICWCCIQTPCTAHSETRCGLWHPESTHFPIVIIELWNQ